jgi:hypothetical protein
MTVDLFEPEIHPLVVNLRNLDIDNLSPKDALNMLYKWTKLWGGKS